MLEEILEYDLSPDSLIVDHDALCVAQSGRLLEVGYLEYEVAAYGIAIYRDEHIHYYISEHEEMIHEIAKEGFLKNEYSTPVRYYFKRYDLLHKTKEEVLQEFYVHVAKDLQKKYPKQYFLTINSLVSMQSQNGAVQLLKEMTQQLDSCFDEKHLQLFEEFLDMLLVARHISLESYQLMKNWIVLERRKMDVETISWGKYKRTYAGFAYQKESETVRYFIDAVPFRALEKQRAFIAQGYTVTPILTCSYYGASFADLNSARNVFEKELEKYCGVLYMPLMHWIKALPASVDQNIYNRYLEQMKEECSKECVDAYRYFGYMWNVI